MDSCAINSCATESCALDSYAMDLTDFQAASANNSLMSFEILDPELDCPESQRLVYSCTGPEMSGT